MSGYYSYTVKEIDEWAFWNCDFETIKIPNSVTIIGEYAFNTCKKLKSITLSNKLQSIEKNTFRGCEKLEKITIPNSVTKIGAYAFAYSGLTEIKIPANVNSIEMYAFCGCKDTKLTIPSSVKSIGDNVFKNATNITVICEKGSAIDNYITNNKLSNVKREYTNNNDNNNNNNNSNTSNSNNNSNNTNNTQNNTPKDTTPPRLTIDEITENGKWSKSKTIKWSATDSSGMKWWKISKKQYDWEGNWNTFDKVGTNAWGEVPVYNSDPIYIYVKDIYGNATFYGWSRINGIDNTKPTIKDISVENKGTYAYIKYSAEDSESGIRYWKLCTKSDGSDGSKNRYQYQGKDSDLAYSRNSTIKVEKNGTYYLYVEDAVGNVSISSKIEVKGIDTEKPYIVKFEKISNTGKTVGTTHYLKQGSKLTFRITCNENVTVDSSKFKMIESTCGYEIKKVNDKVYDIIITGSTVSHDTKFAIEAGLLTDSVGNKSVKSTKADGHKIVVDNLSPNVTGTYGDKIEAKITDISGIAKYQWKIVDDSKSILWQGTEYKNINKTTVNTSLSLNKYKGNIVWLYVEDVLGNSKTFIIKPKAAAEVDLIKRENDILTYRITTNQPAKIYQPKVELLKENSDNKYCKVLDLKQEDQNGRNFLLTVQIQEGIQINETIYLPQGTIYIENPISTQEAEIELNVEAYVDNTDPIISLGKIPEGKQKEVRVTFYLIDYHSGINRYTITKNNKELTTYIVNKSGNSKQNYTGAYTFKENGTFKMTVWDNQGNKTERQITISNVDNTTPKININYSNPDVDGKVEVIISADKIISEKDSNNWTVVDDKTLKRTYDESTLTGAEVVEKVIVTDEVGNQVEVSIRDRIAPRIVGEIKRELIENGITKVEIDFSEEIQDVESPGWELSENKKQLTKEISEYEELTIKDLAGNEIERTIKIEPLNYEEQSNGLVENIEDTTDKEEPVTEYVRVINLKRPIESVDLLNLKDKVEYELSNENKTLTLTFKNKITAGQKIKLKESEENTEAITLDKVSNVVIKGDSNNDGKIEDEDFLIMWNHILGKKKQTNKYRKFAIDMNNDGIIDIEDLVELRQALLANKE